MTTLPKEIINEIGQLVQPKYKCIRVKYTFICMDSTYNDIGFKIREGDKILIIDDEDDGQDNKHGLMPLILNEGQCIIKTKSPTILEDSVPEFNLEKLLSLKVGESMKVKNYEDEDNDLLENWFKVTLVERF